MRVRDRDRPNPAGRLHRGDGRVVDETDAIPEQGKRRVPQQERALADGKGRLGADADEVGPLGPEHVGMGRSELGERGPHLTAPADILALVFAHGAALGRLDRFGVLDAAGGADETGHETEKYVNSKQ